jgi:hypothetical protein
MRLARHRDRDRKRRRSRAAGRQRVRVRHLHDIVSVEIRCLKGRRAGERRQRHAWQRRVRLARTAALLETRDRLSPGMEHLNVLRRVHPISIVKPVGDDHELGAHRRRLER